MQTEMDSETQIDTQKFSERDRDGDKQTDREKNTEKEKRAFLQRKFSNMWLFFSNVTIQLSLTDTYFRDGRTEWPIQTVKLFLGG